MVRGKLELKRIENKINRQVTFAKRRNGLFKKAYELSVLCDAEVAVIVFSNRGRLSEFCSPSSMLKILEKYKKCSYNVPNNNVQIKDTQLLKSQQQYLELKARVEELQQRQRNLLGEDLGPLGTNELEQLESQLDSSLTLVRSTRTQFMLDQLTDLQTKEKMLCESNRDLMKKFDETNQATPEFWGSAASSLGYRPLQTDQPQGGGELFHHLQGQVTLQIRSQSDHLPGPSVSTSYMPSGWL